MSAAFARRRWSVEEFQCAIRLGLFREDERLELLDGDIFEQKPPDPPHSSTIPLSHVALNRAFTGIDCHLRTENPIVLTSSNSQPQPDIVVAQGSPRLYASRHPGPDDVLLLVEVSDSTLSDDRNAKSALYATAGITEYWIVNLRDRQLEVHRHPQNGIWTQTQVIAATGNIAPLSAPNSPVAVADLLP
ncbi:Uma2 family endonuclease [Armatimonas rosea]|uniref:Uma2 family endonuclease n=1 Tax=Armatimonas rosea TaxID=685828 RepID=A0A7W9SUR3_ARMRO|nr:Uma2 family endonuclease [Armatimonas rosea]MBB6053031.1 Uma2 family endonuclease [Armatimonas rosea]